jgi:hypothetical protein
MGDQVNSTTSITGGSSSMQSEDAVNSKLTNTLVDKEEFSNLSGTKSVQAADATKIFNPRKSAVLHL